MRTDETLARRMAAAVQLHIAAAIMRAAQQSAIGT